VADQRERDRFRRLVDDHGAAVLGLLRRLCRNPHDADDLFQETAVRVWRNRAAMPVLRSPRGWLMTIAYRVFLDLHARRPALAAVPLLDEADAPAHAGADADPAGRAEAAESGRAVRAAVETLSPPLRDVVALHYTGGLSLREVAGALGISVGTAKSRLNAALEQLRRRLA
jgi:RNA polymerase sigma-70 factor (ECF subfamily)